MADRKFVFAKLGISKKDRLEIVSLKISISYHSYFDSKAYIDGPIAVDFIDNVSNRTFTVFIPVKDCTRTDVLHWTYDGNGLYIVSVVTDKFGARDICRVFDPSKVAEAIEKLLNGDFDEDLFSLDVTHVFENKNIITLFEDEQLHAYDISGFLSKTLFVDKDNSSSWHFKRCVSNCIDDTNSFILK